MNEIGVVCIIPFLIAAIDAVINPCKDVTFGECDIKKYRVVNKMSQPSVQLCNAECYDTYNCTTYSYDKQTKECILTTNKMGDYRSRDCKIVAGPAAGTIDTETVSIFDCMEQINKQICDSLLEENCEYNGEVLDKIPRGEVGGTCQRICQIRAPKCKYWIDNKKEDLCILKRDGRKTCNGWGGPKEPSFDHCQNLTMIRRAL